MLDVLQCDKFDDGRLNDILFDITDIEIIVAFDIVVADS